MRVRFTKVASWFCKGHGTPHHMVVVVVLLCFFPLLFWCVVSVCFYVFFVLFFFVFCCFRLPSCGYGVLVCTLVFLQLVFKCCEWFVCNANSSYAMRTVCMQYEPFVCNTNGTHFVWTDHTMCKSFVIVSHCSHFLRNVCISLSTGI